MINLELNAKCAELMHREYDVVKNSNILLSPTVNRRSFSAGLTLFGAAALLPAAAEAQRKINEVPIDQLMAPDELSELSLGNKDATVTIVEYMSMSCPACGNFHNTTFKELKKKYIDTGKVRFVIREFPLNNLAAAGAMLARCTEDGAKSIALIEILFAKQRDWVSNNALQELLKIGKQAGITEERFEKCLQDNDMLGKLSRRRDKADKEFGIDATPSFFINGKRLQGRNFTLEAFEKVIEPLLKSS